MSRLVPAEELLVLLNSNTALIFTAAILPKLCFSNLLYPLKLKAICMAPFYQRFQVYFDLFFRFQVYFDSAMHIFSTSKKDHTFFT